MTKTIEFIDEKIKMINVSIESSVKIIKEFDGIVPVDSYKKLVEEHLKDLQTLEQIKCELEAWEVVKSSINLSENREDYKNRAYLNVINYSDKEWLILKKALEVEEWK